MCDPQDAWQAYHQTDREVIPEAEQLVADGVRELIIVAQDTTYYGLDLYGEPRLAELLWQLEQVDGIDWIRLMYLYPMYFDDTLIDTIAAAKKSSRTWTCRCSTSTTHAQTHGSPRDAAGNRNAVGQAAGPHPGLVLRTTFITGFPGETEEQFEELEFVARAIRANGRLHVFLGTRHASRQLPDHLPEEVKNERRRRLMEVQQQIAFAWNQAQIGSRKDVILDRPVPGESNVWIGRSHADAPDIDAAVYVTGGKKRLSAGDIVTCEIVATQEYDLVAVAVGKPAKRSGT